MAAERSEHRWLLLLQQIPRTPPYLRVKIWRRLQRLGAVAVKNGVYALPRGEERNEDLQWVIREIVAGGGDATLVEASFIQGMNDGEVEALFRDARTADFEELAKSIRALEKKLPKRGKLASERRENFEGELKRLRQRFAEVEAIDFFSCEAGAETRGLLDQLDARLRASGEATAAARKLRREDYCGRTWVTRKGIFVDRIASAWLIRRFIDPQAKFKFVPPKGYVPEKGELRFDMFDAEFTHVGDKCTFEVLLERMDLGDRGLFAIAEVVHDIDVKDGKFGSPQAAGLESLLAGIALRSDNDEGRLTRGSAVFDDLYEVFKRKRS
jgi:hypothetical protein